MSSNIQIFNQDCMEGMKNTNDCFYSLIITSPPYNIGNNHHTGNFRHDPYEDNFPENEYQLNQKDFLNECYRITSDDGSMFYNHKNRIKDGCMITPYKWILNTKWIIKQELVWFNGSQNFDKCRFYPMTERIYWLSKRVNTKFYNNINKHDLFDWKPEGTDKIHKRAFPINMVKDILKCFPKNINVLDPFLGSGTTAIACYDMGIDFIGYEIDKDYFDGAKKRIENHKKQLTFI